MTTGDWTYASIAQRATEDAAFRDGLLAAAAVCRANDPIDSTRFPPCPAGMAAVYIDRLANGEQP